MNRIGILIGANSRCTYKLPIIKRPIWHLCFTCATWPVPKIHRISKKCWARYRSHVTFIWLNTTLVAWCHQTITCTNTDFSSMRSCGIRPKAFPLEMLEVTVLDTRAITRLRLKSPLSCTKKLNNPATRKTRHLVNWLYDNTCKQDILYAWYRGFPYTMFHIKQGQYWEAGQLSFLPSISKSCIMEASTGIIDAYFWCSSCSWVAENSCTTNLKMRNASVAILNRRISKAMCWWCTP